MARNGRPVTRWTADTEVAFLLALRMTGSVTQACAEIGRSVSSAFGRRRRMPGFAARWETALDEKRQAAMAADRAQRVAAGELSPDGAGASMPNRARFDGWTALRQRAFLRALSQTGRYDQACRAVGISSAAARAMRDKYPAFAAACDRALSRSVATLEQVAFERAVDGWEEPIVHAGKVVGHRRRYSEPLLRMLLARETKRQTAEAAAAREAAERPATADETDQAILRKLEQFARADREAKRRELIEWADEMQRRGLAP